ncbi:MAG TPA: LacI family DNA-binding transcriptional regulator [Capsulimonadaceae bacterium]|nr:LacI family DNA-binding transcriptional regulator [Capsulimonadaceae bacterium]
MGKSGAATLQDVAKEAGVAVMTVSVVLNGARSSTRVSDATRARILDVAKRLRYRPNAVARGLSRRRMDTIGVVATTDGEDINLYFLELLNGILQGCTSSGQNTTVFSVTDWDLEQPRLLQFCDGRVDGMIFISPFLGASFFEAFAQRSPFVTIHGPDTISAIYNIDADDEGGGYAVTQHMISFGHRRIAHFTGSLYDPSARCRLAGYRRALKDAGIPYEESLVIKGGFLAASGRRNMERLISQTKVEDLPTAIFCASDAIASGCMEALAAHNLRIPDDISIAGFDDLLLAKMTTPPITTIRQPFRKMGARAVELLLHQIRQGQQPDEAEPSEGENETSQPRTETFDVDLVVRGSVGPSRR